MKYVVPAWFGLCLLGTTSPALAQAGLFPPKQLERIREGLRDIYNLDHARAAEKFEGMIREAPDDPAGYVFLASTYWLQELAEKQELSIDRFASSDFFAEVPKYRVQVDPALEARFRKVSQQAIEKARQRLAKNRGDEAALFLLGLAYQNLASFESALKRNWWSAFRLGSKTYEYHRTLLQRDPNFHDARLTTGVYNYVTGSLPPGIRWLAFLMGFRGSKTRGKRELELAAEKALLVGDHARVILILIHTREKNYRAAFDLLSVLLGKYPNNYLVHLDMGGMGLLMKNPGTAIAIYEDILRRRQAGQGKYREIEPPMLYTRLGVALRQRGDLAPSADWFRKALAESGVSARSATVARLEMGKTLDLMGQRGQARELYQAVAAAADVAGTRSEAEQLLHRSYRR